MLLSLGIHVTNPSNTLGDNEASIMRATVPEVLLKKKHVTNQYLYAVHMGGISTIRLKRSINYYCVHGNIWETVSA
jgi:hypothetical protein